MASVTLDEYENLERRIKNAEAKAANAALFGTVEEVIRHKHEATVARARREFYSPRALLAIIAELEAGSSQTHAGIGDKEG